VTAKLWLEAFERLAADYMGLGRDDAFGQNHPHGHKPRALAEALAKSTPDTRTMTVMEFVGALKFPRVMTNMDRGILGRAKVSPDGTLTRGNACQIMYTLLKSLPEKK
jgi:hypothetical protein